MPKVAARKKTSAASSSSSSPCPCPSTPSKKTKRKQPPTPASNSKRSPRKVKPLAQPPFDITAKQSSHPLNNGVSSSASPPPSSKQAEETPDQQPTIDEEFDQAFSNVARLLKGRKNVIVLVGAGISTSCGIPDFRSKDNGLYNKLDVNALGLSCPEELFCYDFFQENPAPFFRFAQNLYFPLGMDKKVQPSDSHKLLALLEQKKMLLRVYSQNIDGLETVAGVSSKKMVYAHGSLQWATCMRCSKKVTSEEIMPAIKRGEVPRCQVVRKKRASSTSSTPPPVTKNSCSSSPNDSIGKSPASIANGGSMMPSTREPSRRTAGQKRPRAVTTLFSVDEDSGPMLDSGPGDNIANHSQPLGSTCGGVLKPAVTFFGETLNDNVRRKIEGDRTKVDALIVIGTSLSVAPISKVIQYLPANIPRILINRTIVQPASSSRTAATTTSSDHEGEMDEDEPDFRENYVFDAHLLGYCDDITRALARKLFVDSTGDSEVRSEGAAKTKRRKTHQVAKSLPNQSYGCLLSDVLEGKDTHHHWRMDDWANVKNPPPDRVLLFPGALASNKHGNSADSDDEPIHQEIAHCDGCSNEIVGVIKKCIDCFDYDLCSDCFPTLSKTHFAGNHSFEADIFAPCWK